jgi:hypothetical protein
VLIQMTLNDEETGPMVTEQPIPAELDDETRRRMAADLFNHTWELLEKSPRSPAEDDEMIHAAHASRYHWGEVGGPQQLAAGEWQCSRVYATLGRAEPALWHARRCVEINEAHETPAWSLASGYEAMARAMRVSGDLTAAREWAAKGRETIAREPDPEDRQIIEQDLDTLGIE